jgi:hypothetical protein
LEEHVKDLSQFIDMIKERELVLNQSLEMLTQYVHQVIPTVNQNVSTLLNSRLNSSLDSQREKFKSDVDEVLEVFIEKTNRQEELWMRSAKFIGQRLIWFCLFFLIMIMFGFGAYLWPGLVPDKVKDVTAGWCQVVSKKTALTKKSPP